MARTITLDLDFSFTNREIFSLRCLDCPWGAQTGQSHDAHTEAHDHIKATAGHRVMMHEATMISRKEA